MAILATILVVRLADLQLVHAGHYRQKAQSALELRPKTVQPIRGRILDRMGRELAAVEPSWDIRLDYGVISMDAEAVGRWVKTLDRTGYYGRGAESEQRTNMIEERFRRDVEYVWNQIARFSGDDRRTLRAKAVAIRDRVELIHKAVEQRLRYPTQIREERMSHTVVSGLNDQDQIAARSIFADFPWVTIEDASRRIYPGGIAFAHILGQMGSVPREYFENLKQNPNEALDEFSRYHHTDRWGVSGVERSAEHLLRGRRGRIKTTIRGEIIDSVEVQNGQDVHLTIRADLQNRLYQLLESAIANVPDSPGGSAVILDVASRDVLAMVSYPGYDPNRYREMYRELLRDTIHQPLRFRAVANQYAPGSIVKPLAVLAGLNTGVITLDTRFDCQGYMIPSQRDRWRCWSPSGSSERMHHGPINAVEAVKYSCNIFMYHTGQLLGVDRLCEYFDLGGLGKTNMGLTEEAPGLVPWTSWLVTQRGETVTPGTARHLAIGQAAVSVTPVQAANLMAVYANGRYRPANLIGELAKEAEWELPGAPMHWRAIRRGMFGVVNDSDGTAHRSAYWRHPRYALCGKTGSAQTPPRIVEYRVSCGDGERDVREIVLAADSRRFAEDRLTNEDQFSDCAFDREDLEVHSKWPRHLNDGDQMHSHAWFAGYLQEIDSTGQPRPDRTPKIAFAVMIEFGGSGGRVAAPVGRDIAQLVVDTLGDDLDPDAIVGEVTP